MKRGPIKAPLGIMVPDMGFEPTHLSIIVFKTIASTNFANPKKILTYFLSIEIAKVSKKHPHLITGFRKSPKKNLDIFLKLLLERVNSYNKFHNSTSLLIFVRIFSYIL